MASQLYNFIILLLAAAFASQALLTAIGSAQFVSNVLFARWLLHEQVRLRVVLATGIIIAGKSSRHVPAGTCALYERLPTSMRCLRCR